MSKYGSMSYQVKRALQDKFAFGESKHKYKGTEAPDYIFSFGTAKAYLHECISFCAWCKAKHGAKTIADCRPFVYAWLHSIRKENGQEYSPYSLALKASAVAKLYGIKKPVTPQRKRENIVRSRGEKNMDKRFSESLHADLVAFMRSTGLRRSELLSLRGNQIISKEGQYFISIQGNQAKGGKHRAVPIINDTETVVRMMAAAGNEKVFKSIPSSCDVHSYRGEYAVSLYRLYARSFDICRIVPFRTDKGRVYPDSVYVCRKDKAGIWYDRRALQIVSRALGHNRLDVVAGNYLDGYKT